MRNARGDLTERRQTLGTAQLLLHGVEGRNVDIEPLIHGGLTLFVAYWDTAAQDLSERSVAVQKAEYRLVGAVFSNSLRVFVQDTIPIVWMDPLPEGIRFTGVIRIQTGEHPVVAIAEVDGHARSGKNSEGRVVNDTAVFLFGGGEVFIQSTQLRLISLHAGEVFTHLLTHRAHDPREFSQFVLPREDWNVRGHEAVRRTDRFGQPDQRTRNRAGNEL